MPSSCTDMRATVLQAMSSRTAHGYPDPSSSRTARSAEPVRHPGRRASAEPGARRALRKSRWIPAFAGMTDKWARSSLLMPFRMAHGCPDPSSSRTVRSAEPVRHPGRRASAEPGARRALRKSHWIPACAGMTDKWARSSLLMPFRTAHDYPDPSSSRTARKRRAGIQSDVPQEPLDPRLRGDDGRKAGAAAGASPSTRTFQSLRDQRRCFHHHFRSPP